ncbi:MAG TPA: threonine/serine dehydratase [Gammaproteobacteria bacterium]|nr:threonine/serine dehydratase [Gammaproteobacteria bacterium]
MATPTPDDIRAARERLGDRIRQTPVWQWRGRAIEKAVGAGTEVILKMELFQYAGTFKPRGALLNAMAMSDDARERGVTAVSAGNHAVATSFAAQALGTSAKVVMPKSANPARQALCRAYGAELVLVDDVHQAFDEVRRIESEEGRTFIHPFEGELTILGTATVGYEWCSQVENLDAVIVPIGGGGLCAGISTAVKQIQPNCQVFGVEPEGADTMHRSFAAGSPQEAGPINTIADSLAAPHAAPYSFELCRRFVDDLVKISDDDMRRAMGLLFADMKLAVEPACAAATAALCGPLRERLADKRVGVILCGTNIDMATFMKQAIPYQL